MPETRPLFELHTETGFHIDWANSVPEVNRLIKSYKRTSFRVVHVYQHIGTFAVPDLPYVYKKRRKPRG